MSRRLLFIIHFLFPSAILGLDLPKDEIIFFNVGQGHAVLINKVRTTTTSYVPLLIDAGATSHPYTANQKYEWGKGNDTLSTSKVSKKIIECWQSANGGHLKKGKFQLNIIITHSDKDHVGFIPIILDELKERAKKSTFSFTASLLLGGTQSMYPANFLKDYPVSLVYSEQFTGLHLPDSFPVNCQFLESSGCITHLFCPTGVQSDNNRWSIVTRIQIEGISAILTGDADTKVKEEMFSLLKKLKKTGELETDILLVPHHGAEETYNFKWDHAVNPRAIVVGAAPNKKYGHPRGETLLELLTLHKGKGRLWSDKVRPHGLQYFCASQIHNQIQETFKNQSIRLFDCVPNIVAEQWHLTWVDVPLYTLWTTGTLIFNQDVKHPIFAEAPYGMMNYVAVSEAGYLFPPHMRNKLTPLSHAEEGILRKIFQRMKSEYSLEIRLREAENTLLMETLLIDSLSERELYLKMICELLAQERMHLYSSHFLPWIREAITANNKIMLSNEARLQEAVKLVMFRTTHSYIKQYNGSYKDLYNDPDTYIFFVFESLDRRALILKTFMKSNHLLKDLGRYIKTHYIIGLPATEIDILCPFGFPEWLQLAKLVNFVDMEIIRPSGDPISIGDIADLETLRREGKNFKEIAKHIIDVTAEFEVREKTTTPEEITNARQKMTLQGNQQLIFQEIQQMLLEKLQGNQQLIFQEIQQMLLEKLENYFPSNLDDFLS